MNNANALLTRLNDLVAENQEFDPQDASPISRASRRCWSSARTTFPRPSPTSTTAPKSFKNLSGKLEVSLGDNVDGLTKPAKDSLQEFGNFMREGSRTAVTLNRVLEKFEANPKGFLLGGSQVPEYTPKGNSAPRGTNEGVHRRIGGASVMSRSAAALATGVLCLGLVGCALALGGSCPHDLRSRCAALLRRRRSKARFQLLVSEPTACMRWRPTASWCVRVATRSPTIRASPGAIGCRVLFRSA